MTAKQSSSQSALPSKESPRDRSAAIRHAGDVLKKKGLRWMQVQFTDLLGGLKCFTVPSDDCLNGKVWDEGIGIDGSSIKGFARVEASDLRAVPDPQSFSTLTLGGGATTALAMADILDPRSGERFEGDPRDIARRAMKDVNTAGFDAVGLSPELEFTVFRSVEDSMIQNDYWGSPAATSAGFLHAASGLTGAGRFPQYILRPASSYMATAPYDDTEDYRNELATALEDIGVPVKFQHHENGLGQQEIEIKAMSDAVRMGDACQIYKYLARVIGKRHGLLPTFMPKPIQSDAGNGMHVHISFWKNGQNAFFERDAKHNISQTMRYFMGGLLAHAGGTTAITNPTVNSYKRLVPQFEAPVFIAWSPVNRTALIRIPARHANPKSINCEPRHSDPSANPYLVFAILLQSGLDGIRKKTEPGDPVNENIFHLTPERLRALGIRRLPSSLEQALDEMESDELVRKVLGRHCYEEFLEIKRKEVQAYSTTVSPWEHTMYFNV
jgi:glutamine synthetase